MESSPKVKDLGVLMDKCSCPHGQGLAGLFQWQQPDLSVFTWTAGVSSEVTEHPVIHSDFKWLVVTGIKVGKTYTWGEGVAVKLKLLCSSLVG